MDLIGNKETTLAVLPFQVIGEQDSISPIIQGFTEDLIINFSKFIGLSVISQFSTQGITDFSDTNAISKLGADYLIMGSFRPTNTGFRIGIQLVRTRDNKIVFAGNHDETLETVLKFQDKITQQVVNVLQKQIEQDLLSYSYKKEAIDLAAYENWLLGMNEINKGTTESDLKARDYFKAALKIDPRFARAYTGISLSYFNEWSCQLWDRWEISQMGAHENALKAIELDENDYISLAVLGRTFLYLGDYEKSEHVFRKSLRMNPNDANNLVSIANGLLWLGYLDEAEQLYLKARSLNPLQPNAYLTIGMLIYFEKGEFNKALELGLKVTHLSTWVDFTAIIAAIYYHLSQFDKVRMYWDKYLEIFKTHINKGKEPTNEEGVEWQKVVNPYKGKSKLEPFWDYILGKSTVKTQSPTKLQDKTIKGSIIDQGEVWELDYAGVQVTLKSSKGLHDIAKLLKHPENEIHCETLMGVAVEAEGTAMVDEKAIKAYKTKLKSLQTDIADAEELGMVEKAEQFKDEYETLLKHIGKVTGLQGKIRTTGASHEKARAAVTWRIRNAIEKIQKLHPQLAKHLSNAIKTGTYCSYRPETPHDWTF